MPRRRKNAWNKWTPEEDQMLLDGRKNNVSYKKLAVKLYRTPTAIQQRRSVLKRQSAKRPSLFKRMFAWL